MRETNDARVMNICVGVVLYNTDPSAICLMIKSLEHQTGIDRARLNLILHSNDGIDRRGIIENIRSTLDLKRLKDIEVSHGNNVGFGAGHNLIARKAHAKGCTLYVGANPDGFFHHRALEELYASADLNGNETLLEARQFPQEHPKTYDHFSGDTSWVSGACFAINLKYFISLGGFDESFFMYCEDVDLSWRVRVAGGKCIHVADAMFYHDTNDERERHWIRLEMLKSGRILAKKWKASGFLEVVENELVRLQLADSRSTLPKIKVTPVKLPQRLVDQIVEFRRLFSFSSSRW